MKNDTLLKRIDAFYSLAVPLGERKISDKNVYVYKKYNSNYIDIYDTQGNLKSSLSVKPYEGKELSQLWEMDSIVTTNPMDALIGIVLCWKLFGPIIPDQDSVSSSAKALIKRYFYQNKDNPQLIKPLIEGIFNDPLRSIYFPNPALAGLVSHLTIINKESPEAIKELSEKSDDLFENKYNYNEQSKQINY